SELGRGELDRRLADHPPHGAYPRPVRLVGRGSPAIRATHAKTLEVTADAEITGRATCVIAVGTSAVEPRRVAGPVRITISVDGESFAFDARANSGWAPGGSA